MEAATSLPLTFLGYFIIYLFIYLGLGSAIMKIIGFQTKTLILRAEEFQDVSF